MTSASKARLVVVKDCTDLFSVSLNVHVLYEKDKAPTLLVYFNHSSLSLSTPEPNNCACDEFDLTAVKNEVAYAAAVEVKEIQYNYWLAHDIAVLIVDQEFPLIGYRRWTPSARLP